MLACKPKVALIVLLFAATCMVCLILWSLRIQTPILPLQIKVIKISHDEAKVQKIKSSDPDVNPTWIKFEQVGGVELEGKFTPAESASLGLGELSSDGKNSREELRGPKGSSTGKVKFWLYPEILTESRQSPGRTTSDNDSCYPRLYPVDIVSASLDSSECGVTRGVTADGSLNPVQHVFFLKAHKTGSQTLTGILNRYALSHNLSVAVRKRLINHDAQRQKNWTRHIRPLPPGLTHYDMLTDHVRFDEGCVRRFLPEDTLFISIVREPLDRFVSAFFYSRDVWGNQWLKNIPGPDPLLTYLSDMSRWDAPFGTSTHSQMSFDFGLEFKSLKRDPRYLQTSLRYLSRVFHLVLLTEAFDESIVLLKRTLSWKLRDMLYVKFNVGKTRRFYNLTHKQKDNFEKHRKEEYAIYRHFRSVFYKKIHAQDDTFPAEVEVFKIVRNEVESFCNKVMAAFPVARKQELRVEGTKFSGRFRVTFADCRILFKETSSVKDTWFEKVMLQRLLDWSHQTWQWGGELSDA